MTATLYYFADWRYSARQLDLEPSVVNVLVVSNTIVPHIAHSPFLYAHF
jgi:hypothetical protein